MQTMLLKLLFVWFLCSVTISAKSSGGVTFKNVPIQGYSMHTLKFNLTITLSNSLKENLPKAVFDKIEIANSEIPVLYRDSVADIEDLDELILENDGISEIQPGAFRNVPQLRKLVITKNRALEQIKSGVFNHLNVAVLDLSDNSIDTIAADAFDDMPELLNIDLADNKLKAWNKNWFSDTPLLTRVSFQNNEIGEIPSEAFKNFQGEKQFGSISLKINIILSNNQISKIHENAFTGLENVNNLWLDGNQIDNWNGSLLANVAVNVLRIENNKLRCLRGDLKNVFVANTTHIDGNPWDCKCLEDIKLWASQHGKDVIMYYSKMTCDVERIDQKLKDLNKLLKTLKNNHKEADDM